MGGVCRVEEGSQENSVNFGTACSSGPGGCGVGNGNGVAGGEFSGVSQCFIPFQVFKIRLMLAST